MSTFDSSQNTIILHMMLQIDYILEERLLNNKIEILMTAIIEKVFQMLYKAKNTKSGL